MTIFESAYGYMTGEPVEEGIARRELKRIDKHSDSSKKISELYKEMDDAIKRDNTKDVLTITKKISRELSNLEKEIRQVPDDDISDKFLGFFTRMKSRIKRKDHGFDIIIPDDRKAFTRNYALQNCQALKKNLNKIVKDFENTVGKDFTTSMDDVKFKNV